MDVALPRTARRTSPIASPTIWGLSPAQVHDRYWASRGVKVVRPGEDADLHEPAELFLLVDRHLLVVFRMLDLVEWLSWLDPALVMIRVRDQGPAEYKEIVRQDEAGRLVAFERHYDGLDSRMARIAVTPNRGVARLWQDTSSAREGWVRIRAHVASDERLARALPGRVFDDRREDHLMAHLECVMDAWRQPDSTIPRITRGPQGSWVDPNARVADGASIVGNVWVGAGRAIEATELVVGPAILWDDPRERPEHDVVDWGGLEPVVIRGGTAARRRFERARRAGKRIFDVVFALAALAITLPLYPFIALAIFIEDGWPVFFAHRRETLGGREFPCLKFRSMQHDAEQMKAQLAARNVSDGPQFFVEADPRSTRVGAFLRTTQLDELPQFINVLLGHMSVVGPRPSPRRENQFCPAWREARLSIRPGVTGLWQIRRTRVKGLDFQEWIRLDMEYVQKMSWHLDLRIILMTCVVVVRRALGR